MARRLRVWLHRPVIGLTLYRLGEILDGDLEELIGELRQAREAERLEAAG
jgi:protein subunit release factor A